MSVEEAREVLNDAIALWHQTRDRRDSAAIDVAEDRLILEVQAEMPCYHITDGPKRSCKAYRRGAGMVGLCPSCTAHKLLKEVTA